MKAECKNYTSTTNTKICAVKAARKFADIFKMLITKIIIHHHRFAKKNALCLRI